MDKETLIQNYLNNKLAPEEVLQFGSLLNTDKEFKKAYTFEKNLKSAIEKEDYDFNKSLLESYDNESNKIGLQLWKIAAVFLIFIGIGLVLVLNSNNKSQDLYAEYYSPFKNIEEPITRGDSENSLKFKAFVAYEAKNYKEALGLFNNLLDNNNIASISFYKAICLLEINETQEAISIFEKIEKTNSHWASKSKWFLALSYLKNNDVTNSISVLDSLITENGFNLQEAKKLRSELN